MNLLASFYEIYFFWKSVGDNFCLDDLVEMESGRREKHFNLIISGRTSVKFAEFDFENKNHPGSCSSYGILKKEPCVKVPE